MTGPVTEVTLADIAACCEGAIPAVIATASADGTPNVTYLSKVRIVDDERVALSNQFFSKTARNLVENPRASILLLDPRTYDQYRLTLQYERTDRRGPVFERLRVDVDVAAALEGMQDVYKLRAADIYRVLDIEPTPSGRPPVTLHHRGVGDGLDPGRIAELSTRLGRCPDLDTVVQAAVNGLAELFGYQHSLLLLLDEDGTSLFTIASHGFEAEGIGSEVALGDGVIGLAAERCTPVTLGNVTQAAKYSRTVRRAYEDSGEIGAGGREIPVPGLPDAASRCAVPAMAMGQLVGVLTVESRQAVAFGPVDEAVLSVVASILANAIESDRARERDAAPAAPTPASAPPAGGTATRVRFYDVDGSVFLDGEYLIKGVAGRMLWALLGHHQREGRTDFTNRELRLDPSLDLPPFKDNFESRLILLKRRLDERAAPVRVDKTGRGRFRLVVDGSVELELVTAG